MNLSKLLLGVPRKPPIPADPVIGSAFGGGYYFGKTNIDGLLYWLVVADKSSEVRTQLRTLDLSTAGTGSTYNGLANTQQMTPDTAYPAAAACRNYVDSSGNQDYYLASVYEMEMLYRAFKPTTGTNTTSQNSFNPNPYSLPVGPTYTASIPAQTTVAIFIGAGTGKQTLTNDGTVRYWTSSQSTADATLNFSWRMDDAFSSGRSKTNNYCVRPIRRILIPGQ